jgi:hypothetical protein
MTMAIAFVQPETTKLSIGEDAWILVKKRLNAGESRRMFAGVIKTMAIGEKLELDPEKVGLQKVLVYLLDWSAADQFPIRGKSSGEVADALNNLDQESYQAIVKAIDTHEAEMDAAHELEKKVPSGESASSATSTSAA